MSEWQDISTAPKDGTTVLLWSSEESRACVGSYYTFYGCPSWYVDSCLGDEVPWDNTHWMPLPAAP